MCRSDKVSSCNLQYDDVANVTSALYYDPTGTITLIGFEHAYDKMHNPQYEVRTHEASSGDALRRFLLAPAALRHFSAFSLSIA